MSDPVPGAWVCPVCGFALYQRTLGGDPSPRCLNDDTALRPQTEADLIRRQEATIEAMQAELDRMAADRTAVALVDVTTDELRAELGRRTTLPALGVAPWLVVHSRDGGPWEVFPFEARDGAVFLYDQLCMQWTDTYLAHVVHGPDPAYGPRPMRADGAAVPSKNLIGDPG